jgi:hypothetical protein
MQVIQFLQTKNMKKIYTLLAFAISLIASAQAPQGFNYQATVRNSSGALIINQNVYFKFNIMLNSQTSVPVYTETHYVPTDDLGQVNLVVGQGTATPGAFAGINWASGTYYLGIELSTTNSTSYVAMGTTQLLSVPYALYANSAGSTTGNGGGFTHYVGELYGGGIVVSVWKTAGVEHGLIASLTNLSSGIQWTTPAFQQIEIGPTAQSPINGLANTNAIVAQAGAGITYAAGLCKAYNAGGFTDWYLPATWELNQCYNAAIIVNEVLGNINGFNLSTYWSSSEINLYSAFWGDFGYPSSDASYPSKDTSLKVRAIRRF